MQSTIEQKIAFGQQEQTKKCPFCAELIQFEAIKCKHCGEFLQNRPVFPQNTQKNTGKWYQSTSLLIFALLTVGPFALPLVWMNPKYKPALKIGITIGVLIGTIALSYAMAAAYKMFMEQFQILNLSVPG